MAEQWTRVGWSEKLYPNDRIIVSLRPRFGFLGQTVNAYSLAVKIESFEGDPRFEVLRWNYVDDGVDLEIRITQNLAQLQTAGYITPGVIIAVVLGLSAAVISMQVAKMVDRGADALETPSGAAAMSAMGLGTLAIVAVVVYLVFFKE